MDAVAATHSVVAVAVLAALLRSSTGKKINLLASGAKRHTARERAHPFICRPFQPPGRHVRCLSRELHGLRNCRHPTRRVHPSLGVPGDAPLRQLSTIHLQAGDRRLRPRWHPQGQHQRPSPLHQRRRERWRRGGKGHRISGDTAGSLFQNRRFC